MKKGLGRGLGALIGAQPLASPTPDVERGERVEKIAIDQIIASTFQPRKVFQPEQLSELVESIREKGIIQPLTVRRANGKYELIAGERRWRAAQEVGLAEVPVIVRTASDREVLELALIENLQRADLNPLEEAEGYALLIHQFRLTQEQVAQQVGKGRVHIANAVRLLTLPEELKTWVAAGQLTVGHAKVLLGLPSKEEQVLAAQRVVKDHLTVRQTEKLVESLKVGSGAGQSGKNGKAASRSTAPAAWSDLEKQLQRALGTRVRLTGTAEVGKVEIEYFSRDEFERLIRALGAGEG